jgi:DNA-binding NtrC family response regulator
MNSADSAATYLPIVLVVDPIAISRFTMWRLLSRAFGVLEASDARTARSWLAVRPDIDALVVHHDLPDAEGSDLVSNLKTVRASLASRAILVTRPVDMRSVVANLTEWFFARNTRTVTALMRETERLVS